MNKKGFQELGVIVMSLIITGVTAAAGTGVRSASPAVAGVTGFVQGMVWYSQMPHVKHDFRVRKAVEQCESEFESIINSVNCEEYVALMDDNQLLDYIRDDDPTQQGFAKGNKAPNYRNISKYGTP